VRRRFSNSADTTYMLALRVGSRCVANAPQTMRDVTESAYENFSLFQQFIKKHALTIYI